MMTLVLIQKMVTQSLLAGNLATERINSQLNESQSVDVTQFTPQTHIAKLEALKKSEQEYRNEDFASMTDLQKSKPKTAMARLGAITDMSGFISTCFNIDTIVSATVGPPPNGPEPFLRQFTLGFARTATSPDWNRWWHEVGTFMPNLHKKCVGFLDGMWADLAHFATDFSNQAVIAAGAPLANLNTERITRAAIAFNAFNRLILEAQATMTPVTDSPAYLGNSPLFGAPVSFLSDRPALANVCNQLR
jgi:hypothetical protein